MKTTRTTTGPKVGDRVRWDGDYCNNTATGTVVALKNDWMTIEWDGDRTRTGQPAALLSTPRWHLLAA